MAAKVKKPDIYSRLTDPKLYTGAHKARFDADGKGRGLSGRDMGNEGKINDLSQLTRGVHGAGAKPRAGSTVARKPVVTSKPHVFGSTDVEAKPRRASVGAAAGAPAAAPAAAAPASPTAAAGGGAAKVAKKGDIYSRLTDPKLYTGAHKARFDADGHGKGIAGRTDVQINDLSQMTRPGVRKSTGSPGRSKAGTVSGVAPIAVTKFGTQAAVAKKIHVFQNGDKAHKGVVITLVKGLANMQKVLGEITSKLTLTTGAAMRVYRVVGNGDSFSQVNELSAFEDGGIYLACGPEKIDKVKLPTALTTKA